MGLLFSFANSCQQPHRIFQVELHDIQEFLSQPAVDYPVVEGQGDFHHGQDLHFAVAHHGFFGSAADRKDCCGAVGNDRSADDIAQRADIVHGESAAGQFVRTGLALNSARQQFTDVGGQLRHAELVGVVHGGQYQAVIGVYGKEML